MAHLDTEAAVADADDTTGTADNGNTGTNEGQQQDSDFDYYPDDPAPSEEPQPKPQGDGEGSQEDDEGDEDGDEAETQHIEAPQSLNAEEREKFATLPPEAKEFFTNTLRRREVEAQQGVQKAVETQRAAERQAADTVAQTQQDFARKFGELANAFAPQPPPAALARSNPAEYNALKAEYDDQAGVFRELVGQIHAIGSEADKHFEAQQQEWQAERAKTLMSDPEFAGAENREAYLKTLLDFGEKELGYKPDGLAQHGEAQDFFNLRKAMRWKEKADKWDGYQKKRNQRPRQADTGRFQAAPAGARAVSQGGQGDPMRVLYPND